MHIDTIYIIFELLNNFPIVQRVIHDSPCGISRDSRSDRFHITLL